MTPIIARYRGTNEGEASGTVCKARGMSGVNGGLARKLIDEGADPAQPIEFWRGETICFYAKPLQYWADRQATESFDRSARIAPYVPMPEGLHK